MAIQASSQSVMARAIAPSMASTLPSLAPSVHSSAWRSSPVHGIQLRLPRPACRVRMAAEIPAPAPKEEEKEEAPKGFTPPTLNPDTPSPIFGGSTGGLLRKAQVEEFYVITWESPKEQIFEMPTGGAAIMREGPNLLKLARKEQCLALGSRLRSKFKITYQFYRVFPNGEVQYLHPKDGVYPEKVNAGRKGVGVNLRSIGKNKNPVEVKFTGNAAYNL